MIDKDVCIMDLDPYTWRNLGEVLKLGNDMRRNFYILCDDDGTIISTYDTEGEVIVIDEKVQDPKSYAEIFIKENPGIQRIFILRKSALIEFNRHMQEHSYEDMDVDEYVEYAVQQFNNTAGIYVYPKIDVPPVIKLLKKYIQNLTDDAYVAICIFNGENLYFSIIIGKKNGKIKFVSTLDYLENKGIKDVKQKDQEKVLNAMKDVFGTNISLKFMTVDELETKVFNA
ncbi:hypothetical protein SAMN02746089_01834 [Caldanaerobius fijiensis DSM 17918]|uniref:Uncharacterized protein n=1 Tax=Caldanaerobius fijiensis DSM 17918 TaxID=1121256 RepID=A0A1M5BBL0_9THEO|nr:hypothetical protein [Caldanaerobius fijiensis]SHF39899.1 hypothetical protein SAMN02746089_01834 [Caldanaerobius fijiensis DSM 17918]